MPGDCPICEQPLRKGQLTPELIRYFDCVKCGEYCLDENAQALFPEIISSGRLCALLNYHRIIHGRDIILTHAEIPENRLSSFRDKWDIISIDKIVKEWPSNVSGRLRLAFFLFSSRYNEMGSHFSIDSNLAISFGLLTQPEFAFALYTWQTLKYIGFADSLYFILPNGWEYRERLFQEISEKKTSSQVFVAMSFSPEHAYIYDDAIKVAIGDCQYKPMIIREKEYNDGIMDNIIAEIRQSRFLIADYTGNKNGVYYEAGFATGLGLNVIKCVHEDQVKADITPDLKIHFDVQHLNFIVWKNAGELRRKIVNRIRALNL
jgi:nucleoside 2-deoxyribosyltransferase